jgi:hypothetical protein
MSSTNSEWFFGTVQFLRLDTGLTWNFKLCKLVKRLRFLSCYDFIFVLKFHVDQICIRREELIPQSFQLEEQVNLANLG